MSDEAKTNINNEKMMNEIPQKAASE